MKNRDNSLIHSKLIQRCSEHLRSKVMFLLENNSLQKAFKLVCSKNITEAQQSGVYYGGNTSKLIGSTGVLSQAKSSKQADPIL